MTSTTTLQRFGSFLRKLHPTYNAHRTCDQRPGSCLSGNLRRSTKTQRRSSSNRSRHLKPGSSQPVWTSSKRFAPPFQRDKDSSKTRQTMSTLRSWLDTGRAKFDDFFRAKAPEIPRARLYKKKRFFPSRAFMPMETIFEEVECHHGQPLLLCAPSTRRPAPQKPPRRVKRTGVAPQKPLRGVRRTAAVTQPCRQYIKTASEPATRQQAADGLSRQPSGLLSNRALIFAVGRGLLSRAGYSKTATK